MRHYTKQPYTLDGMTLFRLLDDEGDPVAAFDQYTELLLSRELAAATVKRYQEVVASYIDYLTEARVFGTAASAADINRAVEGYLRVLGRATAIRQAENIQGDAFLRWARPIADALNLRSVRIADNTVAAINLFLRQSNLTLQMSLEVARSSGLGPLPDDLSTAIKAVDGHHSLSRPQRKALRQNSMLANVIRFRPEGITRPRGLSARQRRQESADDEGMDFPLTGLAGLFGEARSHRDRALWILLAGSGLRTSEALNLEWKHIDHESRRIFVEDPEQNRTRSAFPGLMRRRFKGRTTSEVFIFEPLKTLFFEALGHYLREEYLPGTGHDFVFQDIRRGAERGRPMFQLSDTARLKAFHEAVERAGVTHPRNRKFGLHSLRHTYGVYLLNYLPVPGGYGLQQVEVQRLMGHKNPATTALYAREDKTILASKLIFADLAVSQLGLHVESLPSFVAARLRNEADRLENESR